MTKEEFAEWLAQVNATTGKARRRPKEEEHKLQCACVKWFRMQYPQYASLLFAVPNGGKRDERTAAKLKAEGTVAGVADLLLLVPNGEHNLLAIEMKTAIGRQSPSQKAWQAQVEAMSKARYAVCRSVEEFIETINNYLNKCKQSSK